MTLTEAAVYTKKGMIIAAITLFIIFATWGIWHYYYNYIYLPSLPPVEEAPTLAFGPLPKIKFPETTVASSNFSYSLDTETGDLPTDIPKLFKVYSVAQLATDLLALDRAKKLAKELDFNETPQSLSATQYKFSDDVNGGELIVDLDTGNFKFRRNSATPSAQNAERVDDFIDEDSQTQLLRAFLSSRELLKDQLKNGKSSVIYNNPVKKDSTLVTVNLWQDSIEDVPIVTPKFREGLIKAVGTNNRDSAKKYILMDYTFWPIDLENFGTYPIKTVTEAFEELKNGEGFVAIEPRTANASITKVYMGYYLSEEYSNYLQPVFVFEGPDFAGLVPAAKSEFVENTN
jgi:hypothetical protein